MKTQLSPRVAPSLQIRENLHRMRFLYVVFSTVALLLALPTFAASPRTFTFNVPSSGKTSVGVFSSSNTLIKTMWSARSYEAGTYNVAWDGNLDQHGTAAPVAAPEGDYTLKVLTNNVQYNWEGIIGNSSNSFTSPNVWKSLHGPADLAINGNGVGFLAFGFNEGQPNARRFLTSDPNTAVPMANSRDGISVWANIAVDGDKCYIAVRGSNWDINCTNLITARNLLDDSDYAFPTGQDAGLTGTTGGRVFVGAIDVSQKSEGEHDPVFVEQQQITDLAVQQSGNVLAAAHANLNKVRLFNKVSGAAIGEISITNPGKMSFAPNGDLYVISGNNVLRYGASNLTGSPTSSITSASGLVSPQAVVASPMDGSGNTVLVTDSGTMQVKSYTYTSSWGQPVWTLGQAGGYNAANGPDVFEDAARVKFSFTYFFTGPMLAMQSDGSFWVGDWGNNRILHYAANRDYLGQISFICSSGKVVADLNDSTRVFSNEVLEYRVDYSKPLVAGDPGSSGAWKLVKNWSAGFDITHWARDGFTSVVTLEGHTYATTRTDSYQYQVVELPGSGPVRLVGSRLANQALTQLYKDGSFHFETGEGSGTITFHQISGDGFDTGNPVWNINNPTFLASTAANSTSPLNSADPCPWGNRTPVTSSNRIVTFNGAVSEEDRIEVGSYHLGSVQIGSTGGTDNWAWRGSPGKLIYEPDGKGTFSTMRIFGGLGGLGVFAEGTDIVWGFNGQYASFSNQFVHHSDNGLFVGQYGVPKGDETTPGFSGNFTSFTMVKHGGKLYTYNSDESGRSGISRWSTSGLDTIQTANGTLTSRPGDPRDLVTNSLNSSQILLTWSDLSNNETGFRIERATNINFTQNLVQITTGANATNYTDGGLVSLTDYYYRVTATNGSGDSHASNVSITHPAGRLFGSLITNDGGYPESQPHFAFDGDFSTYYRPTGYTGGAAYVGYDLGTPMTISKLKFASINLGNNVGMVGGVFQASNSADFSSGVVNLYHVVTQPPQYELTTVDISPRATGYRYVRYFGNNVNWVEIAEMQVWGSDGQQYGVGDNAQFIDQSVPSTMTAGQVYSVSVTMKNVGDNTWTNGGVWRLGTQNPQDNTLWTGSNRVYTTASVAPGQQHTFTFNVTAPATAGTYNFQWRMLHEAVTWFGDLSPNVAVNVANAGISSDDIGSPGVAGSAFYDGTTYTVNGGGADIWGTSDQFNYVNDPATGDGTLIAKVTSISTNETWAKAGVMFRDSLAANSSFVMMVATPGAGVSLQWRASTGGPSDMIHVPEIARPTPAQPVWVRLVKTGSSFTGSYSSNGTAWTLVGTTNVTFTNSEFRDGLAVTSHNNATSTQATFTDVSFEGGIPGAGIVGEYFNNQTLNGAPTLTRTDATVNFDWAGSPGAGLPADQFSVRWTGRVWALGAGSYTFATMSDDGVRLWINGALVINNWTDHGLVTDTSSAITLSAGQEVDVKMEFYESGGGATAKLLWTPPGGSQQIIPQSQLHLAALLSTGFETGDVLPTWLDSVDFSSNVIGYSTAYPNIQCGLRSGEASYEGIGSLRYSGQATGAGGGTYAYCKVYDYSAAPITVGPTTTLSYWINPDQDNARYAAVDLEFVGGTSLRDSGTVDQNGFNVHPAAGHGGNIPLAGWSQIVCNLGTNNNGKQIRKIWVAFDRPNSTGQYAGFIDNIRIINTP